MVGKGAHADKRLRKLDCAAQCPRVRSRMGKTSLGSTGDRHRTTSGCSSRERVPRTAQ